MVITLAYYMLMVDSALALRLSLALLISSFLKMAESMPFRISEVVVNMVRPGMSKELKLKSKMCSMISSQLHNT